jgi:hypothetical protein
MATWVYGIGLALGVVATLSVLWVWIRQQKFGSGGAVLSTMGFLLVSLSIWSAIDFTLPGGMGVKVERLQQQLNEVQSATEETSEQLINVAENVETTQEQFVALTDELLKVSAISPTTLQEVQESVLEARPVDLERLRAISRNREVVPQREPR